MITIAMLYACLGACGKDGGNAADGEATPPDPGAHAAEVQAVQAKVPDGMAVTFEAVIGEKDRHLAIQPKGWETGVIPGRVKPPAGSDLGFMTAFSTGSNCDGECTAKDWASVADSVEFAQFTKGGATLDKDEKLPDGRLVVVSGDARVDIVLARWKEGASRYYVCRATLDRELISAAPAFEEACRRMKVLDW
jgi:hypothetical protein